MDDNRHVIIKLLMLMVLSVLSLLLECLEVIIPHTSPFLPVFRYAKENELRIWKGYHPSQVQSIPIKSKNFSGKVVEIVNADALVVKLGDGTFQKIFLSSLRPPR